MGRGFSALQRAENSSILPKEHLRETQDGFSALQRAENSSMLQTARAALQVRFVSVLFSEPKIPQSIIPIRLRLFRTRKRFSALQRAENSSISIADTAYKAYLEFQCSSASRKFLNAAGEVRDRQRPRISVLFSEPKIPQWVVGARRTVSLRTHFSALQRAENSSMHTRTNVSSVCDAFQCSSASRKFLNGVRLRPAAGDVEFQCSSASRKFLNGAAAAVVRNWFQFQCSSASRKFLNRCRVWLRRSWRSYFSALQRAENSSMRLRLRR